ncbi:thioredoxin domain-containing protein [Flavobacteriaceae bacterium]|nr:thioredoxin domain-containing protein [Flavobacteriaceae bacterium]
MTKTSEHQFTNKLINETSPYLLQHAHNPVNWYPWGQEALEKAKKENKLIIISVGYAACHWCHVMEHESFEDVEVANFMNDNFVAIKVDREERPDIDQIYMDAVQLITGSGGWPLNCIALPDGRPIYGGTYFPKNQWLDVLTKISDFVKTNPEKTEQQAKQLTNGIQANELNLLSTEQKDVSMADLNLIFENWKTSIDSENGGYKGAPKFPLPVGYQFLLHYNFLNPNPEALEAVTLTLDKMANGGIYDQIGGGFSRYATDERWNIPHFEKMLYDNSQLVSLYAAAYKYTKNENYKTIIAETLDFIQRELTSDDGGFYASLDADSEGEEGKYYVWSQQEIQQILGDDAKLILDYYTIEANGNWENGINILFKTEADTTIAERYNRSESELKSLVSSAKKQLLAERETRIKPALDDKIITSWNALMLKAYVDAYTIFDDQTYLDTALKTANFINTNVRSSDDRLSRSYKNGKASINGFLDDYAFTIEAFIALYQSTFDEKWLESAKKLTDYVILHFYDSDSGMFYYTSDVDQKLIVRKMEISDNVMPASNSQMAKNLFVLGQYYYDSDYVARSRQMLNTVKENTIKGGTYYSNWDVLMSWFISPPYSVAILGDDFESKRKALNAQYYPNVFFSGGNKEGQLALLENKLIPGQTTIYVCQNNSCKYPVTDVNEAMKQLLVN